MEQGSGTEASTRCHSPDACHPGAGGSKKSQNGALAPGVTVGEEVDVSLSVAVRVSVGVPDSVAVAVSVRVAGGAGGAAGAPPAPSAAPRGPGRAVVAGV